MFGSLSSTIEQRLLLSINKGILELNSSDVLPLISSFLIYMCIQFENVL